MTLKSLRCFAIFAFTFCSIAFSRVKPLVNGGKPVEPTSPIAQSTVMYATGVQYCTATIISEKALLTAAHCLSDQPELITIYFKGFHNQSPLFQRTTTHYVIHGHYKDIKDSDERNDVAMIFFEGGLPPQTQIAPLGTEREEVLPPGTELIIAGYGKGSPLGSLSVLPLRVASYSPKMTLFWFQQTAAQGACHGDSGGPAFLFTGKRASVVGVTSYAGTVNCDRFSVYTNISAYRDWIVHHLH
ncbi:MAG: hypothetical protein RJB66_1823 [Pseudomonadota bacterium]|jgi:secreted trypsin-like serine protease